MPKCEYCKKSWLEADFVLLDDVGYWMCDECRERAKESGEWELMQVERIERWEVAQHVLKTLGEVAE